MCLIMSGCTPSSSATRLAELTPHTPQQIQLHSIIKSVHSLKHELHTIRQNNLQPHDISAITNTTNKPIIINSNTGTLYNNNELYVLDTTLELSEQIQYQSNYIQQLHCKLQQYTNIIQQQSNVLAELESTRSQSVKSYHTLQSQYNILQQQHTECSNTNHSSNILSQLDQCTSDYTLPINQLTQQCNQLQQRINQLEHTIEHMEFIKKQQSSPTRSHRAMSVQIHHPTARTPYADNATNNDITRLAKIMYDTLLPETPLIISDRSLVSPTPPNHISPFNQSSDIGASLW